MPEFATENASQPIRILMKNPNFRQEHDGDASLMETVAKLDIFGGD